MASKQLLQSAGDGTAVPANYVGEVVVAATLSATSTANSAAHAWVNATTVLTLDKGIWQIYYYESSYRVGLTGTSPSGYASLRILNSTDTLSVAEYYYFHFSGAADAEASLAGSASASCVVNLLAQKSFYGQIGATVNSGTTAAFASRGTGKFFAVRIA